MEQAHDTMIKCDMSLASNHHSQTKNKNGLPTRPLPPRTSHPGQMNMSVAPWPPPAPSHTAAYRCDSWCPITPHHLTSPTQSFSSPTTSHMPTIMANYLPHQTHQELLKHQTAAQNEWSYFEDISSILFVIHIFLIINTL